MGTMSTNFCAAKTGLFNVSVLVKRACLLGLATWALIGCTTLSVNDSSLSGQRLAQQQAVSDFYDEVIALNIHGLPTPAELEQLAPYSSRELVGAFEQARLQQDADFARHGGAEPPLVQGSPLVSLFEGATKVLEIEPGSKPAQWQVTLQHGAGTEATQWMDTAVVVQQADRWVVSDIRFNGQWDFARQGWLSDFLGAVGRPTR